MRRMAWMLVLGCLTGCGNVASTMTVVDSPSENDAVQQEVAVPAEIEQLFARGELAQAVEALSVLIEKTPRDASLLALRASTHHRLGQMDRAISDIDRAIELNPRDAKNLNNRGFMRMGMEQFQAALSDFDKASELAPRNKNVFNNRGLLFISQRRFEEAIVQFNRAIEIDDQYLDAYNNRGFAEFESGLAAKALDDFNVVIELNSKYVNAYNNRGLLLAQAGDYENALLDFTRAMMLDPMNPKYYEHRQEVYRKQGEYRKALEDEKKYDWLVEYHLLTADIAAATNPVDGLIQRAEHYLEINDLDKAVEDLNRALVLDPKSSQALVVRAGISLKQKSPAVAQADAEAALAIAPSEHAYSILGDVFLGRGDYDRAIEYFARAHRIDESVADAYYGKSKMLESQGQREQAKNNLEQALALDPDVERRLR